MGVFYIFEIAQMVPNRAKRPILSLNCSRLLLSKTHKIFHNSEILKFKIWKNKIQDMENKHCV